MPIIGEYHRRFAGNPQYSPTFSRGGNSAVFAEEVFEVDPLVTLTVVVQHKNIEDTSWTNLVSLATLTAGVTTQTASAIKELLRFAYTVNGSNPEDSVYSNTLAPSWRPY
jgi:hypothetical protein